MKIKRMARAAAAVFALEDWKWWSASTPPDQHEIADSMRRLLQDARMGKSKVLSQIESGRLLVLTNEDETKVCLILGTEDHHAIH